MRLDAAGVAYGLPPGNSEDWPPINPMADEYTGGRDFAAYLAKHRRVTTEQAAANADSPPPSDAFSNGSGKEPPIQGWMSSPIQSLRHPTADCWPQHPRQARWQPGHIHLRSQHRLRCTGTWARKTQFTRFRWPIGVPTWDEAINAPDNPWAQGPRMGNVLADFSVLTAAGAMGFGIGGIAARGFIGFAADASAYGLRTAYLLNPSGVNATGLLGAELALGYDAISPNTVHLESAVRSTVRWGVEIENTSLLPPPSKGFIQRAVDSIIYSDANRIQRVWGDLNENEYAAIRSYMARTEAGQKVLAAADERNIFFDFTLAKPTEENLVGVTHGNNAKIFLRQTESGTFYGLVGVGADGIEHTANVGLHEGLHALGVGGSRRAEALVRLEELRSMGVPIDRTAMRQVLTDMGDSYDHFKWQTGRQSKYFHGLRF